MSNLILNQGLELVCNCGLAAFDKEEIADLYNVVISELPHQTLVVQGREGGRSESKYILHSLFAHANPETVI